MFEKAVFSVKESMMRELEPTLKQDSFGLISMEMVFCI